MPPFVILALGAVGAVLVAKFLAAETRRVNETLERQKNADAAPPPSTRLDRDPASGEYRPRRD